MVEAMRYLQSKNVKLVYNSPVFVSLLDRFSNYLYEMIIDEQEQQPPGMHDTVIN